uniref:Uncharacterized protein n=1 Tax=Knipowitschia caucasica TaxID=637954 RepID=A0AAV2MQJ4_KNICA
MEKGFGLGISPRGFFVWQAGGTKPASLVQLLVHAYAAQSGMGCTRIVQSQGKRLVVEQFIRSRARGEYVWRSRRPDACWRDRSRRHVPRDADGQGELE